jgi:hypothetical protein
MYLQFGNTLMISEKAIDNFGGWITQYNFNLEEGT